MPKTQIFFTLLAVLSLLQVQAAAGQSRLSHPAPKSPYERFMEKGALRDFPPLPWSKAFQRNSRVYIVKTNTSMDVAEYVGTVMDAIHYHYCRLFGVGGTRKTRINVFRTHQEMADWAVKNCRFNVKPGVLGFYTTYSGGTICVIWKEIHNNHPQTVLMHEGTHQFVSSVYGSNALPIWLNEGFAVYFENSHFDGRNLDVGRVPRTRLKLLQMEMKENRHLSLATLFATGQPQFDVRCYGAAWSFVYWLAHGGKQYEMEFRRRALARYVNDCKNNRKDGKRLIAYLGRNMEQVEKEWKEWVLKLDPNDLYGGVQPEKTRLNKLREEKKARTPGQ